MKIIKRCIFILLISSFTVGCNKRKPFQGEQLTSDNIAINENVDVENISGDFIDREDLEAVDGRDSGVCLTADSSVYMIIIDEESSPYAAFNGIDLNVRSGSIEAGTYIDSFLKDEYMACVSDNYVVPYESLYFSSADVTDKTISELIKLFCEENDCPRSKVNVWLDINSYNNGQKAICITFNIAYDSATYYLIENENGLYINMAINSTNNTRVDVKGDGACVFRSFGGDGADFYYYFDFDGSATEIGKVERLVIIQCDDEYRLETYKWCKEHDNLLDPALGRSVGDVTILHINGNEYYCICGYTNEYAHAEFDDDEKSEIIKGLGLDDKEFLSIDEMKRYLNDYAKMLGCNMLMQYIDI